MSYLIGATINNNVLEPNVYVSFSRIVRYFSYANVKQETSSERCFIRSYDYL